MATTFNHLEEQKRTLLQSIEGWSPDRLRFRPAPNDWSTAEMLDHIVKVEVGILSQARRGLLSPHSIGLRDRLGNLFLDRIFQSERKVKIPSSATQVLPDPAPDPSVILHRWDHARVDLAQFLTEANGQRGGLFRHPVAGWMTLPHILRFFSVHLHHHTYQLERIRQASTNR